MYTYSLKTPTSGFYDITEEVRQAIKSSGVKEGICVVYCPHTTAGITINENADEDVARDVNLALNKFFPRLPEFRHDEGNSDGHVKSSIIGASVTLIIDGGEPILGKWQDVYFAEFDPPRERKYFIKIIAG